MTEKKCQDRNCAEGWTTVLKWGRLQVVPCPVCNPEKAREVKERAGVAA